MRTVARDRQDSTPDQLFGCRIGKPSVLELREHTNLLRAYDEKRLGDGYFEFQSLRDGETAAKADLQNAMQNAPQSQVEYYPVSSANGKVMARLPNGAPMLIRLKIGKGTVYLCSTKQLLSCGWDVVEPVIRGEAEDAAALSIKGNPSWLEYSIRKVQGGRGPCLH